jgi:thiol-disulfide isomerase/thioredoxin
MATRLCILAVALLCMARLAAAEDEPTHNNADNPYLAPADLTTDELVEFIQRMQEKPATIRSRPGFDDALLDAADRVLAATPEATQETVALVARFDVLSRRSQAGDEAAYDDLVLLAKRHKADQRPKIAAHVRLCLLELRAAEAIELPAEDLPRLLTDLKEFFTSQPLNQRHLKLASNTIRAINLLPKADERNPHFTEFGKLFAKSSDPKLARYGRDLSSTPLGKLAELVGQTLVVESPRVDGLPFDWASYRGRIVLVDFWATWCGPCREELPNIKACFEKYHERGFDVVGVSLDQDLDTLKAFLVEEQIPWVNLFDETSTGWDNPIAARYGIKAIPTALLVDRQGKVVSTTARGPELERLVERLLAAAAPGESR